MKKKRIEHDETILWNLPSAFSDFFIVGLKIPVGRISVLASEIVTDFVIFFALEISLSVASISGNTGFFGWVISFSSCLTSTVTKNLRIKSKEMLLT